MVLRSPAVYVFECLLRPGIRTAPRELHGALDLGPNVRVHRIALGLGEHVALYEMVPHVHHRISPPPRLDLLRRAVSGGFADVMPQLPIGAALDQRRAFAAPGGLDRGQDFLVYVQGVVPVREDAGHPVRRAPGIHVRHLLMDLLMRGECIEVVLAHEDHRKRPERGQVQALVKRALVGRAVPEEARDHLVGPPQLRGQPRTACDRNARAHDSVGTEDVPVEIRDVHRAALAPAVPRLLPEQLRHHPIRRCSLGQYVSVTSMRAGHVVVRPQGSAHARGHRLLPEIRVDEPR